MFSARNLRQWGIPVVLLMAFCLVLAACGQAGSKSGQTSAQTPKETAQVAVKETVKPPATSATTKPATGSTPKKAEVPKDWASKPLWTSVNGKNICVYSKLRDKKGAGKLAPVSGNLYALQIDSVDLDSGGDTEKDEG